LIEKENINLIFNVLFKIENATRPALAFIGVQRRQAERSLVAFYGGKDLGSARKGRKAKNGSAVGARQRVCIKSGGRDTT
jgi:hypothetical protein